MRLLRLLSTIPLRLRSLFRRDRVEAELDEEIRDHIERKAAAEVERGVPYEEARQSARRGFGGVEQVKEACRDTRRVHGVEHALTDLRFAGRQFGRAPIVSAAMVGIFALGIGFSVALFLFIRAFVEGPVPGIPRDESVVRIRGIDRTQPGRAIGREFAYPEYQDYAAQTSVFSGVAAWTSADSVLDIGRTDAHLVSGAVTYVTGSYFRVLGLQPAVGAGLPTDANDADPAPRLVAVISDALWTAHFERARDVIGRSMKVNGIEVTIVGVAPRRFAGARTGGSQMRVWLPLNTRPQVQRARPTLHDREDARFSLVARLQPGVRPEHATPIAETIAAGSASQVPGAGNVVAATDVVPLLASNYFPPSGGPEEPSAGRYIALLFPLTVLLITCTNVSALLAGLGLARRREIAVRLALGATRGRVVRQLVTETLVLAIAAGALALFTIWLLFRLFDASVPDLTIEIDARSLALTFGLALTAGGVFGLSPALHATRLALHDVLKDAAGVAVARRARLQSCLVIAQIAFTQPALLGMGALLLDLRSDLRALPTQIYAERLVEVHFNVNPRYGAVDDGRERVLARVEERLAALPGVDGAMRQEHRDSFDVESHPADIVVGGTGEASPQQVRGIAAPAGYFSLMGISFLRGRDFDPAERSRDDAVVIGSGLARRLWGGADPIGRRLVSVGRNARGVANFTVIGVVDDAARGAADGEGRIADLFMSRVHTTGYVLVRTSGPAAHLLPALRAAAADEAPTVPVVSARTLASIEAGERRSAVNAIAAAGGAGALALLLSAIGLYAVVAFAVGQRVREIGIRTALGAQSRQVVKLFVNQGLRLAVIGLGIGLALGIGGVRLMSAARGDEPPSGTLGLSALVVAFVLGVALLASWLPARRAARVDPLEVLRVE